MSISAMTNAALARRPDFGLGAAPPLGAQEIAAVTGTAVTPPADRGGAAAVRAQGDSVATALQVVVTYIPTEIVVLYIAVLGSMGGVTNSPWIVFVSFVVATPFVTWVLFATKLKSAGKALPLPPSQWPIWEMSVATLAFCTWAIAMPDSPFTVGKDPYILPGLSALIVLVTSAFIGLLAPLFQRPLPISASDCKP
jgi:hypothetical protein